MNTDRFLTRVFDKQEKKMIYPFRDTVNLKRPGYLLGVTNDSLILCADCSIKEDVWKAKFGDRFIPMQCWGLQDKNKKLIYDDDIGKIDFQLYRALFNGFAFGFSSATEACNVLVPTTLTRNKIEIIGNYWENHEFMEENK